MSISEAAEPAPARGREESASPFRWAALWPPALIVLATVAVYGGSFRGPFVLDDITSIRDNPTIRHLWPIWRALSPPAGEGLTPNGRPLVNLSLAINYAISGDQVWSYHALNLLIHLLAALTLFGVVRRTLGWSALSPTRWPANGLAQRVGDNALHPTILAFAIALLWAVHPLQTESVTYIVQRAESMMGLFYLLTLYCFIRGVERVVPNALVRSATLPSALGTTRSTFWFSLSILACLCGMASKEVMVSAPLIVLLYDRTFLSGTFAEAWRRHRPVYLGLAATWVLLAYEVAITGNRGGTAGYGSHVAWWHYALTQFPAIAHYLRLCFWPHPLIFDYGMGLAMQRWRVVPSALLVIALLALTVHALRRRPALGFVGASFFAILAPSSSIVPIATETMSEHRMYLPLAAVIALGVLTLDWTLQLLLAATRPAAAARMTLAAVLVGASGLGALTVRRNRDYRSNLNLWTVTHASYPKNMRALYNLGCALTEAGRTEESVADFETVVRVQPDYTDAHQNLANGLVKLGRVEESMVHFEIAAHAHPENADIQCSLGIALLDTDRVEPAVKHLREALRLRPGMPEATYQLGEALLRSSQPAEALALLESAARDRPGDAEVRNALGNALLQLDRAPAALDSYREALKLDPHFAKAHNNAGNVLLQVGQTEAAIAEFRAALRDQPDFAEAHNNLGDALLAVRRPAEAIVEFQAAVRLQPDSADAHYNWANSLAKTGQTELAAAQYREVLRLRPDFAEAHNNLGIALAQLDRLPEARREFAQALRLKPDFPDARDNLTKLTTLLDAKP